MDVDEGGRGYKYKWITFINKICKPRYSLFCQNRASKGGRTLICVLQTATDLDLRGVGGRQFRFLFYSDRFCTITVHTVHSQGVIFLAASCGSRQKCVHF